MRPTNDPKTEVIKIRVNEETAKELRSRGNVSAVVRELVTEGLKNPKSDNFAPHENHGDISADIELSKYGITLSIIADFEVILNIYDTNFEDFFKKLYEKVRDGEIDVDEIVK